MKAYFTLIKTFRGEVKMPWAAGLVFLFCPQRQQICLVLAQFYFVILKLQPFNIFTPISKV